MEIILIKDVEALGLAGQVVKVTSGYARNFLLPTGAALTATEGNLKMLAKKRAEFEHRAKAEKDRARDYKARLAEVRLVLKRKAGEKGKLYGAVTAQDIVEAAQAQGLELDRKRLRLAEPLKSLGEFEVQVRLHQEILGALKVAVEPEEA